jgi:hypothetical protein
MKIKITEETYKKVFKTLLEEDGIIPSDEVISSVDDSNTPEREDKSNTPSQPVKSTEGDGFETLDQLRGVYKDKNNVPDEFRLD